VIELYRAVFRALEPYLFRGPGEFDPSTRGVYSSASSLPVPSPSTVAGALATTYEYVDTKSMDWDRAYSMILKAKVRGPYLRVGSVIYVEDRVDEVFIQLSDIKKYSHFKKRRLSGEEDSEKKVEEICSVFDPKKMMMTGIGLMTRTEMRKIADEEKGLIYTTTLIDYLFDPKFTDVTIELDIISKKIEVRRYLVRLGGEGKGSLLEISKADDYICKIPEIANLLYVLSPILYETGSDFVEQLKSEISDAGDMEICGKIGLLGAGYSNVRRRRKPIYQALLPGSVILLEKNIEGRKIYEEGVGIGKELGFGSVIPVEGDEG
jgi:CRISPR-associated protein Cmr3